MVIGASGPSEATWQADMEILAIGLLLAIDIKAWRRTSCVTELFRNRGADVYDFASVFVGAGQDL